MSSLTSPVLPSLLRALFAPVSRVFRASCAGTMFLASYAGITLVVLLVLFIAGCSSNPVAVAETPAQTAYAISASYNVVLEAAASIVEDTAAPIDLRRGVQAAERQSTPVIEALEEAFADYQVARAEFAAGETTAERLDVATRNLEAWLTQAERALVDLSRATRSR